LKKTIILIIAFTISVSAQHLTRNESSLKLSKIAFKSAIFDSSSDNYKQYYSGINVLGQITVGGVTGLGLSVLPLVYAFDYGLGGNHQPRSNILIAIAASINAFGTAGGVHLIAKIENKEHSFWKTFLFSEAGALAATLVITKFKADDGGTIILVLPLLSSLIYSLMLADWPKQGPTATEYKNFKLKNNLLSFKDLINQSQIVKINLFRIGL